MSRIIISLLVLVFAVTGVAVTARAEQDLSAQPAPVQAPQAQTESPAPTESPVTSCLTDTLLVKMNPGADPATVVARHGGTIVHVIEGIDVQVVAVPAGTGLEKIKEFMADPEVRYAEPNQIVRATQASGSSGSGC
jgi:hypothetical protein